LVQHRLLTDGRTDTVYRTATYTALAKRRAGENLSFTDLCNFIVLIWVHNKSGSCCRRCWHGVWILRATLFVDDELTSECGMAGRLPAASAFDATDGHIRQ